MTRTLSPIPMATVAGHPTMPSLVWTRVEWSRSLELCSHKCPPSSWMVERHGQGLMEFLSRSTPAPQQPCPYRLTSELKRQSTLLNVPAASPTCLTARAVNYISFITLWHRHCSNIKIQTARSDLCDKCDQMLVSLRHTLSDKKRKEKNDQYNQHLIKAKAFRDSYNTNIEDAEKEWGRKRQKDRDQILGCLDSRIQLSPFTSHATD